LNVIEKLWDLRQRGGSLSAEFTPNHFDKLLYSKVDYLISEGIDFLTFTTHKTTGEELSAVDTLDIVYQFKNRIETLPEEKRPAIVAHEALCYNTKEDNEYALSKLKEAGILDLFVVAGDMLKDQDGNRPQYQPHPRGYHYPSQLIEHATDLGFCVGAACGTDPYDPKYKIMKGKQDSGAKYFIKQMSFDSNEYERFVRGARENGVTAPIIPGIKPLTKFSQSQQVEKSFNVRIPEQVVNAYLQHKDDSGWIRQYGIDCAADQAYDLSTRRGAPGVHFFVTKTTPIEPVVKRYKGLLSLDS
jgi:methylenetetrahydrofolate reductase (NADPH)